MLREHLESVANNIKKIGESISVFGNKGIGKIDYSILMAGYISLPVNNSTNYNDSVKELCKNFENFEMRAIPNLLKVAISAALILYLYSNSFAENETKEEKRSLVAKIAGVGEAQAMTLPSPQPTLQLPAYVAPAQISQVSRQFLAYINAPSPKREPREEDFRKEHLFDGYYFVEDKKDQLEAKMMEPVNKAKWKEKFNINKVSTKFDRDKLRCRVRFNEYNNKEKCITLDFKPKSQELNLNFLLNF